MINIRPSHLIQLTLAVIAAALVAASAAGTAMAATQVGQDCTVNNSGPSQAFQTQVSSGASYVAPSSGVIVKWGVHTYDSGSPSMVAVTLATMSGGTVTLTRWSEFQLAANDQASEFPTRLPVAAGELIGRTVYNGSAGMCSGFTPSADLIVYPSGPFITPGEGFMPGSTIPQNRLPIWATIEGDADGDGYGDETQDKCPQSGAYIAACPVLSIGQQLSATKGKVRILATASIDAELTATAKVKLSKKKSVTIKGKATSFKAGKLKSISLTLPKSVKSALKQKRLSATVTLTGNGLANTATATGTVRLKR